MILNTAQEIINHAYTQARTSRNELFDANTDQARDWELVTINLIAEFFYNEVIRTSNSTENISVDTHNFPKAVSSDTEGNFIEDNFSAIISNSTRRVAKVLVKFTENDIAREARYLSIENIGTSLEQLSNYYTALTPLYTVISGKLLVFPVPTETVADGVTLYTIEEFKPIKNLSESIASIPASQRYIVYFGVVGAIHELRENIELSSYYNQRFMSEIDKAVSFLSSRATPVYYRTGGLGTYT